MDEHKKRLLLLAILAVIILGGSYYAYWQKNSASETVVAPNLQITKDNEGQKTELTVYISGAVIQPGVVKVQAGTRIIDVINSAGGLTQGADVGKLNLAQPIKDGMHIKVPASAEAFRTPAGSESTKALDGKININTATKNELDKLPGIGPTLAQRIIDYRQSNGHFKEITEIKKVSGINESRYNKLKDKITI